MCVITQAGDASGWGTDMRAREESLDSGYMLKVQPAGFADGSDVGSSREEEGSRMTLEGL